jgi:predicted nucleic acid-binding protein
MRVYLDTGVFIDYFINRSHAGHYLRTGSRRGRTPKKLDKDVVSCLNRISRKHDGFTSSLTLYELEHALFSAMKNTHKGSSHLDRILIPAARSAVYQGITVAQLYKIKLVDVSETIILKQLREVTLQIHGIMAADSLHIVTAIDNDADVIISTDAHMHGLDNVFQNSTGSRIRCVDTDVALTLL